MRVVGIDARIHNGPGDALAASVKSPPAGCRLDRVRGTEQVSVGRFVQPELVDPLGELGKFLDIFRETGRRRRRNRSRSSGRILSRRNFLISSLEDCTPNSGCSADSFRHTIIGMRLGGPSFCASISRRIEAAMTKLFRLGMCGLPRIESLVCFVVCPGQLPQMPSP